MDETPLAAPNVWKRVFMTVNPLSRTLALLLFILLPFIGGYIGYRISLNQIPPTVEQVIPPIQPVETQKPTAREETSTPKNYSLTEPYFNTNPFYTRATYKKSNENIRIETHDDGGVKYAVTIPETWSIDYMYFSPYLYRNENEASRRILTLDSTDIITQFMEIGDWEVTHGARITIYGFTPITHQTVLEEIEKKKGPLAYSIAEGYVKTAPVKIEGASDAVEYDFAYEGPSEREIQMIKDGYLISMSLQTEGAEMTHPLYEVFKKIADSIEIVK